MYIKMLKAHEVGGSSMCGSHTCETHFKIMYFITLSQVLYHLRASLSLAYGTAKVLKFSSSF